MNAYRFTQPMKYTGQYVGGWWAGYRFKETLGYTSGRHTGVDYNWGAGDEDLGLAVSAIANGEVCYTGDQSSQGFGKTIIIKHTLDSRLASKYGTKALYSRYMHLNDIRVRRGQTVKVAQTIGTCGKTGTVWAHLHLDLWKANLGCHLNYHKDTQLMSYLDPYKFIEANKNNKEVTMPTDADIIAEYKVNRGKAPTAAELKLHSGKATWKSLSLGFKTENDARRKAIAEKDKVQNATIAAQRSSIEQLREDIEKGKVKLIDVEQQLALMEKDVEQYEAAEAKYEERIQKLETENQELKTGIVGAIKNFFEWLAGLVSKD